MSECTNRHIEQIDIVTSPQAKGFYEKMGAVYIDDIESLISKGHMIPNLKYSQQYK